MHEAIAAIRKLKVALVSGTFLDNKWHDLFGLVRMLPGEHPFMTRPLFDRAFAEKDGRTYKDPSDSKRNRLIKWLLGFLVCRPVEVLKMPEMKVLYWNFELDLNEELSVSSHTVLFIYALRMAGIQLDQEACALIEEDSKSSALMHAIRAQQHCANSELIDAKARKQYLKKLKKPREDVDHLRATWTALHAAPTPLKKGLNITTSRVFHPCTSYMLESLENTTSGTNGQAEEEKEEDPTTENGPIESPDVEEDSNNGSGDDAQEGGDDAQEDGDTGNNITETRLLNPNEQRKWQAIVQNMNDAMLHSKKVQEVLACLLHIVAIYPGEDIVVFSTLQMFQDMIEEAIDRSERAKKYDITVYRFDGKTTEKERISVKQQLEKQTEGTKIMLITPGAGGYGLELSTAQHVVQLEPWWNENVEKQAYCRVHRQGNRNAVTVWKITAINSLIDIMFITIATRKRIVNEKIMRHLRVAPGNMPNIPRQYGGVAVGEV